MKIAVFGGSTFSTKVAKYFKGIEAKVTIFSEGEAEVSGVEVRPCKVTQVSKINLLKGETVPSRSRMCDLFRVIFEMNTSKITQEQKNDNPDMFEKLSQSMIKTLEEKIEMAEDFDVIVDCRANFKRLPLGKSGAYCLNERVYSRHENFQRSLAPKNGVYLLAGWGNSLAEEIIKLNKLDSKTIFLFYPKGKKRSDFIDSISEIYLSEVTDFFKKSDEELIQKKEVHQKALKDWESKEDYERVKFPKPALETPSLNELSNMGIVSIDRLEEHDKFFVTYEPYVNFNQSELTVDIKTISVDYIINANAIDTTCEVYRSLNDDEPGVYKIGQMDESLAEEKFNEILSNLEQYFTKK